MNVMEMMARATLDNLFESIPKLLENIPPETLAQVRQIGQFVHTVDLRLARMEANQKAIMQHLGIDAATGEIENAGIRRSEPNGTKQLGHDGT